MKKVIIIVVILFIIFAPISAYATVGPFVKEAVIFVDDKEFALMGGVAHV